MDNVGIIIVVVVVLVVLIIVPMAVKIVTEYERGVIFRLGRLVGAKGPGLFLIIPFIICQDELPEYRSFVKFKVTAALAVLFYNIGAEYICRH